MFICLANLDRVIRPLILSLPSPGSPWWRESLCGVLRECGQQKWGKTQRPRSTCLGMVNIGYMNDGYLSKLVSVALLCVPCRYQQSAFINLIRYDKPDFGKTRIEGRIKRLFTKASRLATKKSVVSYFSCLKHLQWSSLCTAEHCT